MSKNLVRSTTNPVVLDDDDYDLLCAVEEVLTQANRMSEDLFELKVRINALRKLIRERSNP